MGEAEQFVVTAFEAWNRGDLEGFLETLDPEIEWRTAGIFPGLDSGSRRRAAVREFWKAFHEPWERLSISYDEITETAPGEVLLRVLFSGVGRGAIEAEMAFGQHYVLRDGLLAQMRSFRTWELAAAASLPPAAVIFDNDGLLLDTESVWTRAEQALFERRGLEFTLGHKRELVGTSAERGGHPGAAGSPSPAERELIVELDELVWRSSERGPADGGAHELVAALRRRARRWRWSPTRRRLHRAGPRHRRDGRGLRSDRQRPRRPGPEARARRLSDACALLGVAPGPEVIALEDSPTGVASGRAAGLTVMGVPSVPGVDLPEAHHAGDSLEDAPVLERLGLAE